MKIEINKEQLLEFFIEISGAQIKDLQPRLIFKDKNMSLCFEGKISDKQLEEGKDLSKFLEVNDNEKKCEFKIPRLDGIIKQNLIEAEIEIIYNDKYLKPWKSQIEIDRPIVTKVRESKSSSTDSIKISSPTIRTIEHKKIVEVGSKITINNKGIRELVLVKKILKENDSNIVIEAINRNRNKITLNLRKKKKQ